MFPNTRAYEIAPAAPENQRLVIEMVQSVFNENPSASAKNHNGGGLVTSQSHQCSMDNIPHANPELPSSLDAHFKLYLKTTTRQLAEKIQKNIVNSSHKSMETLEIEYKENLIRLRGLQNDLTNSLFENSLFANNNTGITTLMPEKSAIGSVPIPPGYALPDNNVQNHPKNWSSYGVAAPNLNANNNAVVNPNMYSSTTLVGQMNTLQNIHCTNLNDLCEESNIFGLRNYSTNLANFSNMSALKTTATSTGYDILSLMPGAETGADSTGQQPFCTFCKRNNEPP